MRVIVIGAGEVGYDVARILSGEQHDVVIIDLNEKAIEEVGSRLDVMAIHGNGTSMTVLDQAGLRKADMLVAVTAIDEVNIIASMIADRVGVPTTIARVRSEELSQSSSVINTDEFGIDLVIHPEESTAAEVSRLVKRASATDVLTFLDGRLQLVGIRLDQDSGIIGSTLAEVVSGHSDLTFRVMALVRGIRTIVPHGEDRFRRNDQIFVLAPPKYVPNLVRLTGKTEGKAQEIMILGGNTIGARIALLLSSEKNKRVKLIEPNRTTATKLAEELKDVLVIHGEGTDIDLLATEGLGEMDAFVAVTDDEESNLVTCLLAKHLGVKKTIALLSKGAYIPISQSIGLDAAVSSKLAVSREILRFLRGKHVLSVATVPGLDAEILEIEAAPRAPITYGTLAEIELPRGVLVGAVSRGKNVEIATGDTHVNVGDRAIVFVLPRLVSEVEKLFSKP
ncbi:MAG: Trk system potassium transporter TrkA [Rhodothermales bacterium]|nr:Trk system potassium transporter TrkA [Rhodothermales bacterium]